MFLNFDLRWTSYKVDLEEKDEDEVDCVSPTDLRMTWGEVSFIALVAIVAMAHNPQVGLNFFDF